MVRLHFDGSLRVLVGTSEMGQGSRTVMAQIAADNAGVPLENISVVSADTSKVPYDAITASSRSTVFMGNALVLACKDLVKNLVEIAKEIRKDDSEEILVEDGKVKIGDASYSYSEVMQRYFGGLAGELIGFGTYKEPILPKHPLKGNASFWEVIMCATEVEVDKETGMVHVHKLATVGDVGKAINPLQVKGQDEGGAIMGLGHSLMEHLMIDDKGMPRNASALDYRIPTIMDIPDDMITILVENQDGSGPEGSKGTGESGIIPIGSAIGLAVGDATGVVFHDLPLTPERVWQALNS
jgi:CO/xanthine dehydrogenase Mo-binding subunit